MTHSNKKDGMSVGAKVAIGAGATALAAAALGAAFLYGTPAGAKRRKAIKSWMFKLKGDIMDRVEKMEDVTEAGYHKIVDAVAAEYKNIASVDYDDLVDLVSEIKGRWNDIADSLKK